MVSIRVRKIGVRKTFLRKLGVYEVSSLSGEGGHTVWSEQTGDVPGFLHERCGWSLGDGYTVRDAADAAWDGNQGRWVSIH